MPSLFLSQKRDAVADPTDERKIQTRLDGEVHRLAHIRCAELEITTQDYGVRVLEGTLRPSGKVEPSESGDRGENREWQRRSPPSGRCR